MSALINDPEKQHKNIPRHTYSTWMFCMSMYLHVCVHTKFIINGKNEKKNGKNDSRFIFNINTDVCHLELF